MNLILESLTVVGLLLYYWVEAIVLFFVPASFRRKDVGGQRVLVTGAGSGLGRLLSQKFADLGCHLVLWDINKEMNEETARLVKRTAASVHTVTCDLSRRENVYAAAAETKKLVEDIDILINNAGIVTGGQLLSCPDTSIERCMDVNTNALFWTTKCFLPGILKRNKGHIVTVASAAGLVGINTLVDYCSSKFGAVGFDDALRQELSVLGKDGVYTTCVCPFYINTGMFEGAKTRFPTLLPILEPEYVVDRIMDAILTNKEILCLPRIIYIIVALKYILPLKCSTLLAHFFGANNSMDDFVGRNKDK